MNIKRISWAMLFIAVFLLANVAVQDEPTPEVTAEAEVTVQATDEAEDMATAEAESTDEAEAADEAESDAAEEPEATPETGPAPIPTFSGPGIYTVGNLSNGLERSYIIYIPESYDETADPYPLIFAFHGAGGTGASVATYSDFNTLADEENFIIVYPNGVNRVWNDARVGDSRVGNIDDVGYISSVIDYLSETLNIDEARVYATGHSMGGMFAFRLGCELQDKIAAIASVASTLPEYLLPACVNAAPIPVLVIQGTDDEVIPWSGIPGNGRGYLSALNTMRFWVVHNECSVDGEFTTEPDRDRNDGTRVMVERYTDCTDGADVTLYGVYHGGHTWPGHPITAGNEIGVTSMDIDATRITWEFFQQYSLE